MILGIAVPFLHYDLSRKKQKGPINMAGWLSSTTVIPLVEITGQTRIAGVSNGYKRYKDDHDERHELVNFVQFPTNAHKDW